MYLQRKRQEKYEKTSAISHQLSYTKPLLGCLNNRLPSGTHFFVNSGKFGLSDFREFVKYFPETSQVN